MSTVYNFNGVVVCLTTYGSVWSAVSAAAEAHFGPDTNYTITEIDVRPLGGTLAEACFTAQPKAKEEPCL
jgi:hypothetical protein